MRPEGIARHFRHCHVGVRNWAEAPSGGHSLHRGLKNNAGGQKTACRLPFSALPRVSTRASCGGGEGSSSQPWRGPIEELDNLRKSDLQ